MEIGIITISFIMENNLHRQHSKSICPICFFQPRCSTRNQFHLIKDINQLNQSER